MLRISLGREEEFRYSQEWLTASAAVDHIIAATEEDGACGPPSGNVATDTSLSRLIGSLRVTREQKWARRIRADLLPAAPQGRHTMWFHLYIAEKLREIDQERLARIGYVDLRKIESQRVSVFGKTLGRAGRSLRRFGETLELWATPANERETLRVALARARRPE